MTNFTTRMMIAAATVVVAAGAASAQTLKAEIPFAFRAGKTVMSAGTYEVSKLNQGSGSPLFRVRDEQAKNAIALMPQAAADPTKAVAESGKPAMVFECVASRCALSGIYYGPNTAMYQIRQGDLGNEEPVRVAMIILHSEKAN